MSERIPLPIPFGWFRVVDSGDLAVGDVRPVRYAARDLVVYRDDEGEAHLADAYRPHLGAHLGHGGKVVDNTLRCPFHGWQFDGTGSCVQIRYAKRIPPQARIQTFPTCEKNGDESAARGVGRAFIEEVTRQYTQDIPIWENKKFLERPVLCEGDGPIGVIRKYYAQFYA